MNFKIKPMVAFLTLVLFSPIMLATEGTPFLLPYGDDDPLQLKPFLQHFAPVLSPFYNEIQNAKADADTEKLYSLKVKYDSLDAPKQLWEDLAQQLHKVKGDIVIFLPQQDTKQLLGSILFYPQELIHNPEGDETIYSYPGLAASLTISASFKNPLAIYDLSKGYKNIAAQCRRSPQEDESGKEEERQVSEDNKQALKLYEKAIRHFKTVASPNEITRYYLTTHLYKQEKSISEEAFEKQLRTINHPYAFYELGTYYENKGNSMSYQTNSGSNGSEYTRKAYEFYCNSLERGNEKAIFGIHRLAIHLKESPEVEEELYKKGKALGAYLAAERLARQLHSDSNIKDLYDQAGQCGRLYSYITLAEKILRQELPSLDRIKDAIFYYQKADRPGFANGTRNIVGIPRLCPEESVEIEFTLHMIKLKDIRGYESLLTYWSIPRYRSYIKDTFTSKEEILNSFSILLNERVKVLQSITAV